jgi:hypothetical protein
MRLGYMDDITLSGEQHTVAADVERVANAATRTVYHSTR